MIPTRFNGSAGETSTVFLLVVGLSAPDGSQQIDGFRARELFAGESLDKTAAADLALRFHAPQHRQQIAPGRRHGFAGQQIAEQHAPSQQQLFGEASSCGRPAR